MADERHYENDYYPTTIEELEWVRSPFYDLAKYEKTEEGEKARELLDSTMTKSLLMTPIH
jgi:hypothetical protein